MITTRWVVWLASSLSALGCSRSRDNGSADTAHTAVVSDETTARPNPAANEPAADLAAAHFRTPDRLVSYVADSGLTYVDVNGVVGEESADTIAHVTVDSLRAELRAQRGNLYSHFQSLAKLYADSTTAYYRIRYCPLAGGFIAVLGHGDYTLAFRRQGGRPRLTRFAALEVAAD